MTHNEFRQLLDELADTGYRAKALAHYPAELARELIGVPVAELEQLAREVAHREDWRDVLGPVITDDTYEEVLLQAMVMGEACSDRAEAFECARQIVAKLDSVSLCDALCLALRPLMAWPADVLRFILPYLHSERPMDQRFAIVMLLDYFVTTDVVDRNLELLSSVRPNHRIVLDALCWGYSVLFLASPHKTFEALSHSPLPAADLQAVLQRIIASPRIHDDWKTMLQTLQPSQI